MAMPVAMGMLVAVLVVMGGSHAVGLAGTGALQFTESAALGQAFNMVMVAFLNASDVLFEPQHLGSVLAQGAVHRGVTSQHVLNAFPEGIDHQRMVSQVSG